MLAELQRVGSIKICSGIALASNNNNHDEYKFEAGGEWSERFGLMAAVTICLMKCGVKELQMNEIIDIS